MKKLLILNLFLAFTAMSNAQQKPNIWVILADDLGYGDAPSNVTDPNVATNNPTDADTLK
jgi:hypothetical protein